MQPELFQYINSLNARRRRQRKLGWGLILFGICAYIDGAAGTSLPPLWFGGLWAFAIGTPLIVAGVVALLVSYKLPIREALMLANLQQGKLTAPGLSIGLDVTLDTAEEILAHLRQKGYAQVSSDEMEEGVVVYHISGVSRL